MARLCIVPLTKEREELSTKVVQDEIFVDMVEITCIRFIHVKQLAQTRGSSSIADIRIEEILVDSPVADSQSHSQEAGAVQPHLQL